MNKLTTLTLLLFTSLKIMASSPEQSPKDRANALITDRINELRDITDLATRLMDSCFCNPDQRMTFVDATLEVIANRLLNSTHFQELFSKTVKSYWNLHHLSHTYNNICNLEETRMNLEETHEHNCKQLKEYCSEMITTIRNTEAFYRQVVEQTNAVAAQYEPERHDRLVRKIYQYDKDLGIEINSFLSFYGDILMQQLKAENKRLIQSNEQQLNHALCQARIKAAEDKALAMERKNTRLQGDIAQEKQRVKKDLAATQVRIAEMSRIDAKKEQENRSLAQAKITTANEEALPIGPIETIGMHYLHGGCTIM